MANLKKKKKYQGNTQSLVTTPTASDTLTAIQMRNLWRTTGENTDRTFEFVDHDGTAKKILEDTDKKTGDTHKTEQLLKDEYGASRLKETAAAEAERLERLSKGSGKPGPYEYKKGGTKKKFVPATDEEIAAAGKRNPPLAYMAAQSIAKQERVWVKKKKMGGVKELYKKGGVKKSTASEFLEPPSAYNLDS